MNKTLRPLEIITSFYAQGSITLYLHLANCFISHPINHKHMEDSTIQSKQSYTKKNVPILNILCGLLCF